MKYLLYITLSLLLFTSCEKDETGTFDVDVPKELLKFKPTSGGAVMFYSLPEDKNIYSVNVYYTDGQGKEVRVAGSYLSDSLTLTGFTTARKSVPAKVTFENRDKKESNPINVTFDTDISGTVAIFNDLTVEPHWDGFILEYEGMPNARGIISVFYKGLVNNQVDTILLEEFPISEVDEVKTFHISKGSEFNDIIVRTQDNRGYLAEQKVFQKVKSFKKKKINYQEHYDFLDPFKLSVEREEYKLGKSYLFDKKKKGEDTFGLSDEPIYYTFLAGPQAISTVETPKYFVIDLKEKQQVASLRLHSMLDVRTFAFLDMHQEISSIWCDQYPAVLPSHVKVFGSNDDGDDMTTKNWTMMKEFIQNPRIATDSRWSRRSPENGSIAHVIKDANLLSSADELFLLIDFPAELPQYRYIRFEIYDTFDYYANANYEERNFLQYFSFNELEVFVEDIKK